MSCSSFYEGMVKKVVVFQLIASLLFVIGIVLLLKLTPERVTDDILKCVSPKQSLRDKVKIAQGKKKCRMISIELKYISEALTVTGKGGQFAMICTVSLILLFCGGVFAVLIDNIFLVPVMATALALIPFVYAKSTITHYNKYTKMEMETALSGVTTAYIRTDDIVRAVNENISYIKPPIRDIFRCFLGETTAISSDIKSALVNLKDKINDAIFKEWCDTLIACQDDRTLKMTLLPIISKLTDVRIVNNELKTIIYEPQKEYWTMVALVVGNIPLLYMLNHHWFYTLMSTIPGKIVISITGAIIFITAYFMRQYTRPIEYKR